MMKNNYFTNKNMSLGVRCIKGLFLDRHHPELGKYAAAKISPEKVRFQRLVQNSMASGGIDLSEQKTLNLRIKKTESLLKNDSVILYNAAFRNSVGDACIADIVIKNATGIHLLEIKCAKNLYDYHLYDAAFKGHCITSSGYKISSFKIAYINKKFVRESDDLSGLIVIKNLTTNIHMLSQNLQMKIRSFKKVLDSKTTPEKDIGMQC